MRSKILQEVLDETPKEVEIFVKLYSDIVLKINQLLKEKGLTQKALAEKLEKQPSEIHRWLSGEHNFTLRSLAKIQAELGEVFLEVTEKKPTSGFMYPRHNNMFGMTVHRIAPALKKRNLKDWKYTAATKEFSNVR